MIDTLKDLWHQCITMVAIVWFRNPATQLTVIGITGTDGKTTTTSLIYHILVSAGIKASMISTVGATIAGKTYDTGFHVTTPNSWQIQNYLRQAVDHGDTHMVLEVTSHALAQHRVDGVPFAVGVITNITHEHLDWHKTFERYADAKLLLLKRSKVAIVNREMEAYEYIQKRLKGVHVVTYGKTQGDITCKNHPFRSQLLGDYNISNTLAAIAATEFAGVSKAKATQAVASFHGITGRMEIMAQKPIRIIVDFAHTPNAIGQVLSTVRKTTTGRLIHVFGSAGLRDQAKRPRMGEQSSRYADTIILTEEDYRTERVEDIMDQIQKGISPKKFVARYADRFDAIQYALSQAKAGDTVILTGKGHEKSLCRGTVEYPWSDQETVRSLLKKSKPARKKSA